MHEVRVRDDGDERERDRGVEEPHGEVGRAERALRHPRGQHPLPEEPTDGRPRRPGGTDRREAARLHDEPGHVDDEEHRQRGGEARGRIDPLGAAHETAPQGHAETQHEEEPEHIQHGLVDEVEGAAEELVAKERHGDVVVDRREGRPDEERQETPEHDRVHDAGVRLRERARLAERVSQDKGDAVGNPVEARLGTPGAPEAHALGQAVDEDGDGDDRADVERDLGPDGDVPEGVAERHGGGHEDSNLSTVRIACAAA